MNCSTNRMSAQPGCTVPQMSACSMLHGLSTPRMLRSKHRPVTRRLRPCCSVQGLQAPPTNTPPPRCEDIPAACFGIGLLASAAFLPAAPLLYSKKLLIAAGTVLVVASERHARAALASVLSPTLTNTTVAAVCCAMFVRALVLTPTAAGIPWALLLGVGGGVAVIAEQLQRMIGNTAAAAAVAQSDIQVTTTTIPPPPPAADVSPSPTTTTATTPSTTTAANPTTTAAIDRRSIGHPLGQWQSAGVDDQPRVERIVGSSKYNGAMSTSSNGAAANVNATAIGGDGAATTAPATTIVTGTAPATTIVTGTAPATTVTTATTTATATGPSNPLRVREQGGGDMMSVDVQFGWSPQHQFAPRGGSGNVISATNAAVTTSNGGGASSPPAAAVAAGVGDVTQAGASIGMGVGGSGGKDTGEGSGGVGTYTQQLAMASTPLSLQLQPGSSTTGSTTGSTACMICTEAELEEAVQHAVEAALLDSNLKLKLQANFNTLLIIMGVVFFWRGTWTLLDSVLGDSAAYAVLCCAVGLLMVFVVRALKLPTADTFDADF